MVLNLVLAASPVPGGGYVSIFKIVVAMLILLVWARLLSWADVDAPVAHLPRTKFNVANLSGMVAAYALFFLLPSFWISLPVLLIVAGVEVGVYLDARKKIVGINDLRRQFDNWLASFSKKKQESIAGQVILIGKGGKAVVPPDPNSPDRAAYDAAQLVLTDPLKKKADEIDLDGRAESGTSTQYVVDGMSYSGRSLAGVAGGAALGYLKGLAGLDVEDRRKPQSGTLKLTLDGQKYELKIQTSGSTAGESMKMLVNPKGRHVLPLDQLGFRPEQLALVKASIKENKGVVLLSSPRGMGLTSLTYGILRGHDAFLQHIQTIEREPEEDLEGITQNKLPANATAADEYKMVDWVISQEPDSIFVNKIEDPRTATALIEYAKNGKRVYVAMRTASTFEALTQWRKLVAEDNLATETLTMVINSRVLRKLCNNCKVGYAPDPVTLKKLGMSPEKVTQLFQARTTAQRDQKGNVVPCEFCQELRYKGRTGVFEIMTVDDDIRQAVIGGKPIEPVFRKQRSRFLQEEALALVEKGDTSVQEVKRILKPDAAATASKPAAPSMPAPPVPATGAAAPRRTASAPARKN